MEQVATYEWIVTYSGGSTEAYSTDLTLELVCAYIDDRKEVIKIEKVRNMNTTGRNK